MAKETILLRSGEQIQRVVRDLDFMHLCDGQQYARCTYNGQEIEISRKRNENGEWTPTTDPDESDEDRLERQAAIHLEVAALHRDDPLF